MLDLVGDENEDLIRKQRVMRWDQAKRKYVATTVGDELQNDSKTKKLRLESGHLVKGDKLKLGELYQKWQKKTNRSIGRTGVFDDDDGGADIGDGSTTNRKKKGGKKGGTSKDKELKSSAEIKKEREKKQNMKIKNMKKGDRRHLEQKMRSGSSSGGKGKTGGNGKIGGKGKPAKKR